VDDIAYVIAVLPMRQDPEWIKKYLEVKSTKE
jgi:hypothetical protein